MSRFAEHFNIPVSQAGLDFVDVPLDTDLRLFIDPYALATTRTPWGEAAHALASNFFQSVLERLRAGDRDAAVRLVAQLREDNRTRLGYSQDVPQGTGLGRQKAEPFLDAIVKSEAFASGRIEDIEDAALLVAGIGHDIVSDMITNVLRVPLAEYTADQCRLHDVPMTQAERFLAWDSVKGWVEVGAELPSDGSRAVLLVPRAIVRKGLTLQPGQYLKDFLDEYYEHGHRPAMRALETMLQNVPTKKSGRPHRRKVKDALKKKGPLKSVMARITDECPEALKGYKRRARGQHDCPSPAELEELQWDRREIDMTDIVNEMRLAAANADDVWDLAVHTANALVAALHPILQHPRRLEADGSSNGFAVGVLANTGTTGMFFNARKQAPNLVVLTKAGKLDQAAIDHALNPRIAERADAGMTFLIGTSIARDVRERRPRLAKRGLVVASVSEIAKIVELDAAPEVAAGFLADLVAP